MAATAGKVLMLMESRPGCRDGRLRNESEALIEAGYHVSVISPRPPHGTVYKAPDGLHQYQFPPPPEGKGVFGFALEYTYALLAMFVLTLVVWVREGFDVVHAHNPPDMLALIAAFYKPFGKRFVFDHRDLAPEMYDARGGASRLLRDLLVGFEKLSCRLADLIIVPNESYKAMDVQRGRTPAGRIVVVREGPDLHKVRLVEPDPELRQRAHTILGYVGTMGPQDGVDYLLRALSHLVHDLDRRDVFCVLIGAGEMVPELEALTRELHLEQYVWITGWLTVEALMPLLSATDICVAPDPSNPYTDRSTIVKMAEYMALSKPIVAFDLPEHRVTAQGAAIYVRPNDEFEFARQIDRLMDSPEQRAEMGRIGRLRVEAELSWAHQARRLLAAYASLLRTAPARSSETAR